jgi:hypothetical protein
MNERLADLQDQVRECMPSSFGVAPIKRDTGAPEVPLGERFGVHVRPAFDGSFFELFDDMLSEADLPQLFWGAAPRVDLTLEQLRQHAALRACAMAARCLAAGRGVVSWARVVREIVAQFRGEPRDWAPEVPASNEAMIELRRQLRRHAEFPAVFAEQLEQRRPIIVLGNQAVVRMPIRWDFTRPATKSDVADVVLMPAPWFEPITTAISRTLWDTTERVENENDAAFYAQLCASGCPVRGTGDFAGFEVSVPAPNTLRVSLDAGGAFFMEVGADRGCVVWPPCVVYIDAECSTKLTPGSDLAIRVRPRTASPPGSVHPGKAPTDPAGLAQWFGNIILHPFASNQLTLCCGSTTQRYRRMGNYTSMADVVLHGHLRAAARVLRHGWKRTNTNKVYRDYRESLPECLHALPLKAAQAYCAKHPETELVRWDR